MGGKWTRSDVIAAASLIVAVVFWIIDNSGMIFNIVGPNWHLIQPFAIFAVGVLVGFAISNARNSRKESKLKKTADNAKKPQEARSPSGKLNTNMAAADCLPSGAVAAAVAAFDSRLPIELGRYEESVRKSIQDKDGVFVLDRFRFNGCPGKETGRFGLSKEWRGFMDDAEVLKRMRERAERWYASQERGIEWRTI